MYKKTCIEREIVNSRSSTSSHHKGGGKDYRKGIKCKGAVSEKARKRPWYSEYARNQQRRKRKLTLRWGEDGAGTSSRRNKGVGNRDVSVQNPDLFMVGARTNPLSFRGAKNSMPLGNPRV